MSNHKTLIEAVENIDEVVTPGDLRRIVGNSILALARKEIPASHVEAMANGLDAISASLNVEIRAVKVRMELKDKGVGALTQSPLGQPILTNDPREPGVGNDVPGVSD